MVDAERRSSYGRILRQRTLQSYMHLNSIIKEDNNHAVMQSLNNHRERLTIGDNNIRVVAGNNLTFIAFHGPRIIESDESTVITGN